MVHVFFTFFVQVQAYYQNRKYYPRVLKLFIVLKYIYKQLFVVVLIQKDAVINIILLKNKKC